MSRVRIVVILACILLAVIATAALIRTKKTPKGPAPNAANRGVPVLAEPVVARDVPVYLRGLGSVSAFNTVTVRARVDGQITKINFQEGQEVQQGQLLVQIDVLLP